MELYRRFQKPVYDENGNLNVSPVNASRILSGYSNRPQLTNAVQWHTGDDTRGLAQNWLDQLEDGDYIVLDNPEWPYVWKKEDFENNHEHLPDLN